MSIYISIACLGIDTELERTIDTAIGEAHYGDNVVVGVACIGNKEFYENIRKNYEHIKNIKIKYFDYENNIGIGKARNLAASQYDNEDFFLQVDSHTNFYAFWDIYLLNRHYDFYKKFNHTNFIFTGYPPPFYYINKTNILSYVDRDTNLEISNYLGFNKWIKDDNSIIKWQSDTIKNISLDLFNRLEKNEDFLPAPKVCGSFIFGDKKFAQNICLDETILWNEEIIQSIELIENGFILVYPGEYSPISHLYDIIKDTNSYGYRETFSDFIKTYTNLNESELVKISTDNYIKYLTNINNAEKIKKFEEYNNISILNNKKTLSVCPDYYINLKK